MTPGKNRVDAKNLTLLFKNGKTLHSPLFTFRFIYGEESQPPRISFVVPKSVEKQATGRNHLRRLGYRVIEGKMPHMPRGLVGVFIFKKRENEAAVIEHETESILHRAG